MFHAKVEPNSLNSPFLNRKVSATYCLFLPPPRQFNQLLRAEKPSPLAAGEADRQGGFEPVSTRVAPEGRGVRIPTLAIQF